MHVNSNNQWRVWLSAYAPLFIWTLIVIGLGSGMGSMNETSRVIRPLLEFLFPGASPETIAIFHGYIRKFAHFAEYAVLAVLAFRALGNYRHRFAAALGIVALVAVADELNQSFNPARTSSPWDVLLDISGGAFVVIAHIILALRQRSRNRRADS